MTQFDGENFVLQTYPIILDNPSSSIPPGNYIAIPVAVWSAFMDRMREEGVVDIHKSDKIPPPPTPTKQA